MRPLYFLSAVGFSCAILAIEPLTAQVYSVKNLGLLPQTTYSEARGINQSGQVIGFAGNVLDFELGPQYYFLYRDGKVTRLDFAAFGIAGDESGEPWKDEGKRELRIAGSVLIDDQFNAVLYEDHFLRNLGVLPGFTASVGIAVNASGEVAGYSGTGPEHAFLYEHGNMLDLGTLDGSGASEARGINDFGDVTGNSDSSAGYEHAFLYHKNKMLDIGVLPGKARSDGMAINNSLEITGHSSAANFINDHAFLWSKGKMIDLGVLPTGITSQGESINSWGQVVGLAEVADPSILDTYLNRGFLYSNGKLHNLNDLIPPNSGWVIEEATGINDRGEIAGTGTLNGVTYAVLLTLDCGDHRNRDCEPCRYGH
jgi:probable HAF family extracellular repeat protein